MEKYLRLYERYREYAANGMPVTTEDFIRFLEAYYRSLWGIYGPTHRDDPRNKYYQMPTKKVTYWQNDDVPQKGRRYRIPRELRHSLSRRSNDLLGMLQWFYDEGIPRGPYGQGRSPIDAVAANLDVPMLEYLIIHDPAVYEELTSATRASAARWYSSISEIIREYWKRYSCLVHWKFIEMYKAVLQLLWRYSGAGFRDQTLELCDQLTSETISWDSVLLSVRSYPRWSFSCCYDLGNGVFKRVEKARIEQQAGDRPAAP